MFFVHFYDLLIRILQRRNNTVFQQRIIRKNAIRKFDIFHATPQVIQ